jgi:hypothetical protein
MPDDVTTTREPGARRRLARRIATVAVIVASVAITVVLKPDLPHDSKTLGWFVLAFVVANLINAVTWVIAAGWIARHAHRNRPQGMLRTLRSLAHMREWSGDTLDDVADDRWFRVLFDINATAAIVGAIIPAIAIVVVLPPSGWGLLAICALDITGAALLRRAIHRKLDAARRGLAARAEAESSPLP